MTARGMHANALTAAARAILEEFQREIVELCRQVAVAHRLIKAAQERSADRLRALPPRAKSASLTLLRPLAPHRALRSACV